MLVGLGLGGAMTLASTAIMTNTSDENSGMAASIEEVSFEFGGSLGIAVLGGLFSMFYSLSFNFKDSGIDLAKAKGSLDETLIQAEQQPESISKPLIAAGKLAFDQSFSIIMMIGSVIIGATIILLILLDYKTNDKLQSLNK